jgi:hypothetical protein
VRRGTVRGGEPAPAASITSTPSTLARRRGSLYGNRLEGMAGRDPGPSSRPRRPRPPTPGSPRRSRARRSDRSTGCRALGPRASRPCSEESVASHPENVGGPSHLFVPPSAPRLRPLAASATPATPPAARPNDSAALARLARATGGR